MRRATRCFSLLLPLILSGSAPVIAGGVDLRIGGFYPQGGDTLWSDACTLYRLEGCRQTGTDEWEYHSLDGELKGLFGGVELNAELARYLELGVHLDGYGRSVDTSYRDYRADDGTAIRQTLRVSTVPLGATLRLLPTGAGRRFVPFVGAGVAAVFYSYEEEGEFIDFYDPGYPVLEDHFKADGVALGGHVAGGLRVYLNRDLAIVGEGRYQWVRDEMDDDFAPNESGLVNRIDLSGPSFTIGVHLRF